MINLHEMAADPPVFSDQHHNPWIAFSRRYQKNAVQFSSGQLSTMEQAFLSSLPVWILQEGSDTKPVEGPKVIVPAAVFEKIEHLVHTARHSAGKRRLWMIFDQVPWELSLRERLAPWRMTPVSIYEKPEGLLMSWMGNSWKINPVFRAFQRAVNCGTKKEIPAGYLSLMPQLEPEWLQMLLALPMQRPQAAGLEESFEESTLFSNSALQKSVLKKAMEGKDIFVSGLKGTGKMQLVEELVSQSIRFGLRTLVLTPSNRIRREIDTALSSLFPHAEYEPVTFEEEKKALELKEKADELFRTYLQPVYAGMKEIENLFTNRIWSMDYIPLSQDVSVSQDMLPLLASLPDEWLENPEPLMEEIMRARKASAMVHTLQSLLRNARNQLASDVTEVQKLEEQLLQKRNARIAGLVENLAIYSSSLETWLFEDLGLVESPVLLGQSETFENLQQFLIRLLEESGQEASRLLDWKEREELEAMVSSISRGEGSWDQLESLRDERYETIIMIDSLKTIVERLAALPQLARDENFEQLRKDLQELSALGGPEGLRKLAGSLQKSIEALASENIPEEIAEIMKKNREKPYFESDAKLARECEELDIDPLSAWTALDLVGQIEDILPYVRELTAAEYPEMEPLAADEAIASLIREIAEMPLEVRDRRNLLVSSMVHHHADALVRQNQSVQFWMQYMNLLEEIAGLQEIIHEKRRESLHAGHGDDTKAPVWKTITDRELVSSLQEKYDRLIIWNAEDIAFRKEAAALLQSAQVIAFSRHARRDLQEWSLMEDMEDIRLEESEMHDPLLVSFLQENQEDLVPAALYPERSRLVRVLDGRMERGPWSRGNRREAARVVEVLKEMDETAPDLSKAVLTLSRAQEKAVRNAIRREAEENGLFEKHPALKNVVVRYAGENEDTFDVVVLSTGFARDILHRSPEYGVLARKKGDELVDEAVSAARHFMTVVTSLDEKDQRENPTRGEKDLFELIHLLERAGKSLPSAPLWILDAQGDDGEEVMNAVLDQIRLERDPVVPYWLLYLDERGLADALRRSESED